MKHLLLLASVAAMVGLAAPAHADFTGSDAGFLAALDQAGFSHRGPNQAITAGQAVCKLMDAGLSPMETVNAVQRTNPAFTLDHATRFAGIAAVAYCPEHI